MTKPLPHFRTLYLEYSKLRTPSIPDFARVYPTYLTRLRTTNGMTQAIIGYIRLNGWFAERISNTGRQVTKSVKRGKLDYRATQEQIYIPGTGCNGTSDIAAVIAGKKVSIEVKNKYTGDSMRPAQAQYAKIVEATGGVYYVATCFEDFVKWFDTTWDRNPEYLKVWQIIIETEGMAI